MNVIIFNSLLLAAAVYSLWRGGSPERTTAIAFVVGAVATRVTYTAFHGRFQEVEYGTLVVDLTMLAAVIAIALRANRYWPLVFASLHLATVIAHGAKMASLDMPAWTYQFLLRIWAYPMIAVLIIGTARHRYRLRQVGVDAPWS